MPFVATVLRVMIASPSDISDARDTIEKAVHSWNDANARSKNIVLLPWRWETSSVPVLGEHPQSLINSQGVTESDIVFAIFGGRLGSPTVASVSGTVEEIEEALTQNTPVHLYFSTAPLPHDVDTAQLDGLRTFKEEMSQRGLYGEFANPEQLTHEVWKAIEHDLNQMDLNASPKDRSPKGIRFSVQPRQEREIKDYDNKGKPRYRNRHWVEITNAGEVDAENVYVESGGEHPSMLLSGIDSPTTIYAGQTRIAHVAHMLGGDGTDIVLVRWTEDGSEHEQAFHV